MIPYGDHRTRVPRRPLLAILAIALMSLPGCTTPPPSGLDLSGYDRAIRPQDDLFRFANGGWLNSTEIPPDRVQYGVSDVLADKAEADIRGIAEELDAATDEPGSESQKIADLYASFQDEPRLNALGATPLAPELAQIDSLNNRADLVSYLGHRARAGIAGPIALGIGQDARNASAYAVGADQGTLTLPDRDYYLVDDERFSAIHARLRMYVTQILGLAGIPGADTAASRVFALESRLARAQWTKVALRDPIATYNKFAVGSAPGLNWTSYLTAAGIPTGEVLIGQPSYFAELGAAMTEVPLEDWKSYLKFSLLDAYAPYLSTRFVDTHFEFHRLLTGQQQLRPRWKRGISLINSAMGEAIGRRYVERYFTPEAKQGMDQLVGNLIAVYRASIDELDWMSAASKAEARNKLDKLSVKIGHPSTWKDYSALAVHRDDLIGNLQRSAAVEHAREVAKLGKPVDRNEWNMTPQTVNAYYNPLLNEIVFPAAFLQPPFFTADADSAANYGGIGAVIGHEISHAFDDQGRKFDGTGNLRDWWTPRDQQRFTERAAGLVAQYSGYRPIEGATINGELTLGENIADLAGVIVAFKAYLRSLGGAAAPSRDGFTGEQRFFLGYAQGWREKIRDDTLRQRLLTDVHSPAEYRTNGVLVNVPAFYEAFGVNPGDRMFRPPDQRVSIW